jgi:N-acyl-D-aspartate/D-glutamate deacylase
MRNTRFTRLLIGVATVMLAACGGQAFDVVLAGGRVMDPESGLDAVRNIGIRGGRIEVVTEDPLDGDRVIDVEGLLVAPGFIDLHQHGHNDESYRYKVLDGVTTSFELEVGTGDVAGWYAEREGGQISNYGVSIGHIPVRMIVMGDEGDFLPSGPGGSAAARDDEIEEGLQQGAVAVGFGLAYTPAATRTEFETMLEVAAEHGASAHIHVREGLAGLREAIAGAARTGAALHVVHVNSSGGAETAEFLSLIEEARAGGQDVTTEAYPYEAGATRIESALFDDWESQDDAYFQRHQWAETGERLTRESFARYRAQGGRVFIHSRTEEMTRTAMESPLTMIASDGGITDGVGHPRSSGTYAKVLGKYVREQGVMTLMDALRRMTIAPARRLGARVPAMRNKGRIRVGADADITVFDPETVIDRSTYVNALIPSEGFEYVLVNGVLVVDGGEFVEGVRPGNAVRAER